MSISTLVSTELSLDWKFSIKHSISKVKLLDQMDEKLIGEAHFPIVTNNKVENVVLKEYSLTKPVCFGRRIISFSLGIFIFLAQTLLHPLSLFTTAVCVEFMRSMFVKGSLSSHVKRVIGRKRSLPLSKRN